MAMERPIIMGVRGESAEIVRRSGAGIEMEPSNPQDLVACVRRLRDDSELYQRLSDSGRDFVLNQFSRDRLANDFLELIERVADRSKGRT
jgi:glycosyltransferase involved in cell wall biosynthesis